MEKLFGCIQLPGLTLLLISSTPWNGLPIGRLGVLLKNRPRKQRDRVREFYSDFSPVAALLGEMLSNERAPTVQPFDAPLCLISRFRDNIYLLLCNVPADSLPQVKQALSALLRVVYGIQLKWELHGEYVTWGEGKVSKRRGTCVRLLRKACTLSLDDPPSDVEWGSWVDRVSPHAKQVWKSQFPSLLLKCMWYALTTTDFVTNLRSVIWGMGAKSYPRKWWHPTLWRLFHKHAWHRVVGFQDLLKWVEEGTCRRATDPAIILL